MGWSRCLGGLGLVLALGMVSPVAGQASNCQDLAPVIAGCILGTLALCGIILAIVLCVLRKKRQPKAATKTGDAGLQQAHVNPAFQQDDTDRTTSPASNKQTEKANDISFAEKGFSGYVQCQEYTSHTRIEAPAPHRTNGNVQHKWSPKPIKLPSYGIGGKMTKTGSRGSLDDGYPSMDPEVVSVSLQSQDIIGLGFNICGNLRDGIFVSQVHNRGPASESGRIKPGDRILGITISFENTVYEDALTILSYASPYPVQLQIQKKQQKIDSDVNGEDYEEALHLHHPIYRSQSMDDVSKIAQESIFRHRRARSEMKRGSSKSRKEDEELEEGTLRKWSGKPGFGQPVSNTDIASDEKSEDSTISIPDMRVNASLSSDLNVNPDEVIEATVHRDADIQSLDIAQAMEGAVNLDDINMEKTEAPTLGMSPSRQAELDRMEGLRLSYEADMPAVRKLDLESTPTTTKYDNDQTEFAMVKVDNIVVTQVNERKRHESGASNSSGADALGATAEKVRRISSAETDEAKSSDDEEQYPREGEPSIHMVPDVGQEVSLLAENSSPFKTTEHDDRVVVGLKTPKRDSDDAPSGPPSPPPGPPPDDIADVTESSMHVLLSEDSIMMRDRSIADDNTNDDDKKGEEQNDDSIQTVLKDYFSDQPSLMARLGLGKGELVSGNLPSLPKRLSGSERSERSEKSSDHDSEGVGVTNINGTALHEAKLLIRRKSSSDEEEPAHAISSPSLSSRSESPVEEPNTVGEQKDGSHLVTKRSTDGLTFITKSGSHEGEVDDDEPNIKTAGGVAYYVNLEDQLNEAPLGEPTEVDDPHPSLIKALGLPNMRTTHHYEVDEQSQDTLQSTPHIKTETITSSKILEFSNNNNEFGVNGNERGTEIPLRPKDQQTEVSKSSDIITVIPHEEVPGAFTLTVNASHHEDSEA